MNLFRPARTVALWSVLCAGSASAAAATGAASAEDQASKVAAQPPQPPPGPAAEGAIATPPSTGAPPEAALSPPEDAVQEAGPEASWVRFANPAFPRLVAKSSPEPDPGLRIDEAALTPYFADGAAAAAKAAYDRGHYANARRLLEEAPKTPQTRYLAALAAVKSDDHAYAAPEMEALASEYPRIADRALTHAGRAYAQLGQHARAATLLAQVPAGSLMYPAARVDLGNALRAAGDYHGAIQALEPLANRPAPSWGRDLGAAALLQIADMAARVRDTQTEVDALESIWAAHPFAPEAEIAEKRLGKKARSMTARVVRAESLIDAHRNKQGLELLEPLLPQLTLPDPLACRAHFIHGKALRKERQHTAAIARLAPMVEACTDPSLRVRALYVLGSSGSIVDHPRGIRTYVQLAREFPEHSFADDALFFAADLLMRRGEDQAALEHLSELARLYPQGDFAGEALFKSFWVHRTRGHVTEALATLDRIEAISRDKAEPFDFERARYWRARTLQDRGDVNGAMPIFMELAGDRPATYYGLMARKRVLSLDPSRSEELRALLTFPTETESPWPLHAGTLSTDPHFLVALEYLRLGMPEAVASELLAANRTGASAEANRLVVFLLDRLGEERAAHGVARLALQRDLSGRITPRTRRVWEIAYPLAYRELVEKHAGPPEVPADLLQGLMREESALDPNALSWAGAMGLVQLMPATARAVAAELKLRTPRPKDLLDPSLNLRLGAHYLGGLIKRFEGELVFAVGSYNAGPGAVNRWRRDRPDMALDAWAEEIPIAETRGYVKRVLRSYNTYQLLYGTPLIPLPPVSRATSPR